MTKVEWDKYEKYLSDCKISQKEMIKNNAIKSIYHYLEINPAYQYNAKVNGENQPLIASIKDAKSCEVTALPNDKLFVGDMVECYGENWIVTELFTDEYGITSGKMLLCNNILYYQNNSNTIHKIYSVIEYGTYTSKIKEITINEFQYIMYIPLNEETKKLYIDKRLSIGKIYNQQGKEILQVVKIVWIDKFDKNFSKGSHLLKIKLVADVYNSETDNIDNQICDYVKKSNFNIDFKGYEIKGNEKIKIGTTRTYSLYTLNNYDNVDWKITNSSNVKINKDNRKCQLEIQLDENLIGKILILDAIVNDEIVCSKNWRWFHLDKTNLDEIIEYPNRVKQIISQDKNCIALLLNKSMDSITEEDFDYSIENNIFDYEYVTSTTMESKAYIWVEADVPSVKNEQIKTMRIYITVACHKDFMKIDNKIIPSISGNRRDNLIRYIDKKINGNDLFGIGKLKLNYVKTMSSPNSYFTLREVCYIVPDFNIKDNLWS